MNAMVYMYRSEDSFEWHFLPSTLLVADVFVVQHYARLAGQHASRGSPVSVSSLAVGPETLKIHPTVPGFIWDLWI